MLTKVATPAEPARDLERRVQKLTAILEVAKALTVERDLDRLLALVLDTATRVVDADRSSIFLVDRDRQELWTRVAQGTDEIRIPLDSGVAGHVATSGQVLNIPDAYAHPSFNRNVDLATGYRTRNMLCVPMRRVGGEVSGVLQALNKREGSFTAEDEELLLALGGQAASSIDNALLHDEIQRLFEGFVNASVLAIESRDPTTAGHSSRVAKLSVALAEALEDHGGGPYADLRFSRQEIDELRYASLLHDFGKVGVREPVLVKADKLYPFELEGLRSRFELAKARLESASARRALERALAGGADVAQALAAEAEQLGVATKDLDEFFAFILNCNKPTVLEQGGFEKLRDIASRHFPDGAGSERPLLTEHELKVLSIPRGSLSTEERREIESHVLWTFRFLSQIPWTRSLKQVPAIAYAHHEKLDGRGYPRQLKAEQIPVQSRIIAIADVYDALTAADRPYKKALPHDLAIDILGRDAQSGQLDAELFRVFRDAKIPHRTLPKTS